MARLAEANMAGSATPCAFWCLPATAYVTFFAGTPLFVQILLIHFAPDAGADPPGDGSSCSSGDAAREIRQNYGAFCPAWWRLP